MCENTNKAYDEAINYLKTSPMFNLSLSSNELFHSNFLYWIWQVNKECFKTIINSLIGEKNYWEDNWEDNRKDTKLEVRREYKNFDLSIVKVLNTATTEGEIDNTVNSVDNTTSESDNGDYTTDGLILFVLENKVKSIPYAQQLRKYNKKIDEHNEVLLKKKILEKHEKKQWLKKWHKEEGNEYVKELNYSKTECKKVLLSLTDAYPDIKLDREGEFKGWKKRSYDDYLSFLKAVADSETITCEEWDKYSNIFTDYREYVKNLITCIKEWDKFPKFNVEGTEFLDYPFLPTAEELRLHALYSKYNYAKLCCILMQKLKADNEINRRKVQYIRKQDDIILLTGQDPKKKSQFNCYNDCFDNEVLIGVGYDYTNMKPLLEVKVVKKTNDDNKLIYIIQVQGDKYEHGIIRKGTRREVKNFIESNDGPKNWVNSIDENDIFGKPITDRYNGYDDTYSMVYKYRQITDKAKTEDVINYMVKDVKKLLEGLGNK